MANQRKKKGGKITRLRGSAQKKGTKNLYYEMFAAHYETKYGLPYHSTTNDFVQLARLFRGLGPKLTLQVFKRGVENYLATEQRTHTLADLACSFVPFWRSPMNEFGRPIRRAASDEVNEWQRWLMREAEKLARSSNTAQAEAACELIERGAYGVTTEAQARAEIERIKAL